jgi:DNA invertase Pin-like site-specific DNA recombinase
MHYDWGMKEITRPFRLAYSYVRFSSPEQRKSDSRRRQWDACVAFCKEHSLVLEKSRQFYDEAMSGFTGEHRKEGALGKFLALVKKNRVPPGSILIVEAFDRLSREDIFTAFDMFSSLLKNDIDVVTLMDQQWYSKDTIKQNMGQLFISLGALWSAHNYSSLLSNRVGKAWDRKQQLAREENYMAQSVVAADVNGDGKLDLISANAGNGGPWGNTLSVLTNNGNGGFTLSSTLVVGTAPYSVFAGDFNGDGKCDLACVNYSTSSTTLTVLTNNGTGGFQISASYNVGNWARFVTAADVNGDGIIDLICASGSGAVVLTNDGKGVFSISGTYGSGALSVAVADINGDGKPDLIIADNSSTLKIYTNNGSGYFSYANSVGGTLNGPWSVVAADVNGDGWPDLICQNYFTNTVSVLTNNQNGGFALAATLTAGNSPEWVTAADLNGDGRIDIICANAGSYSLSVFINTSTFTPSGSLRVNLSPTNAVSAGAHWQVDGGAWQNSGATVYRLSGGSHALAFSTCQFGIGQSHTLIFDGCELGNTNKSVGCNQFQSDNDGHS